MSFSIDTVGRGNRQKIYLSDTSNGTVAEIFAFGALLNAFTVNTASGNLNVIDGFNDADDAIHHITDAFKSAKMSPFACRLRKGHYRFNDKEWIIKGFFLGDHALHGFLYNAVFTISNSTATTSYASVTLEYHYNGTVEGFPFTYTLRVQWELRSNNHLTVTTTAIHDSDLPVPFSDGWHPYFTLGTSIDECELQFNSDRKLEFDAELIPTGKEEKDERFINGCNLNGISLDNSFILPLQEKGYCAIKNKQVRIWVEPVLNYPYLQVYIPAHRKSIAIENLSAAPDAFNNGMGLIQLQRGEPVSFVTGYRVELL